MASPDWSLLAGKYLYPYIVSNNKEYSSLFKSGTAENIIHNQAFNMENEYFAKLQHVSKKDIHKQGIVVNSAKMLPYIQTKLMQEGRIVKYSRNGKEIIRNNVEWSEGEISEAENLKAQGVSIKSIAKRLGRSYASTYQKLRKRRENGISDANIIAQ